MTRLPLVLLTLASGCALVAARNTALVAANPIRKVVTLLQKMQKDVTDEGEKEKALFDKYMCWCKTSGGELSGSIAAGQTSITNLGSEIKATSEKLAQAKEDLATAQADRSAAKTAMAEATALREKEAAAYAATKAEYGANIHAIFKAVEALEKGMAGSFLQTSAAEALRKLVASGSQNIMEEDRQQLLAFLSQGQGQGEGEEGNPFSMGYAPSSGQVTGILKTMGDEMGAGLKEATETEDAAIAAYDGLMAAKTKEVNALSAAIEAKLKLIGDLSVAVAQMKNELTDTEEALLADQEFLGGLDKACASKKAEWEERSQTRADELSALADAIKMLNDDDALELFKKTLPSASASFLQVKVGVVATRARALAALRRVHWSGKSDHAQLDLIALALHGKKIGFEKVIKMIDSMVVSLKQEQLDDDHKKEYCASQFDLTDDSKKALERKVSDLEAAIASTEEGIATTKEEIAALETSIKDLDTAVAEATEQRKEENEDYKELMASDSAAKELLGIVENRLNKFYNPKLYKAPPKIELSASDRVMVSEGIAMAPTMPPGGISGTGVTVLAQITAHVQHTVAPPPPPETFGAYVKKGESSGVMKLMGMLIADLDKEMTEATTEEKDAQADYEAMMKSSAAKRSADSKSLTEKESIKASLEGDLEAHTEAKASTTAELTATLQYIAALHLECDWLLKYFDVRKEARASEVDALGRAKAVLSGADYSLTQTKARRFLARGA
jgi:septal ring factor EnvC (AmiA/AmiB activator)